MIVTADTLSTPVVSSGYYYPGIVLSVLVRIKLRLVFSCFLFTGTEFYPILNFTLQNCSIVGKATEAIWGHHFVKTASGV